MLLILGVLTQVMCVFPFIRALVTLIDLFHRCVLLRPSPSYRICSIDT